MKTGTLGEAAFRSVPPAALALIREYEGLRLIAYRCPAGVWTIGYGHTGAIDGRPFGHGMRIDRAKADALLAVDADAFARSILGHAKVPLTDGQFGALVSFAFNLGWGALEGSGLWRKVQADDMRGAANEFGKWTYAAGKVLPGLVRRRAAERAMFEGCSK